jgi:hypothetical protein
MFLSFSFAMGFVIITNWVRQVAWRWEGNGVYITWQRCTLQRCTIHIFDTKKKKKKKKKNI